MSRTTSELGTPKYKSAASSFQTPYPVNVQLYNSLGSEGFQCISKGKEVSPLSHVSTAGRECEDVTELENVVTRHTRVGES